MVLQRLGVLAASTFAAVGGIDTLAPDGTDLKKTVIGLVSAILVHVLFGLYKKIVKGKKKKKNGDSDSSDYSSLGI